MGDTMGFGNFRYKFGRFIFLYIIEIINGVRVSFELEEVWMEQNNGYITVLSDEEVSLMNMLTIDAVAEEQYNALFKK